MYQKLRNSNEYSDTTPEILLEKLKESKSNRPGGYKTGDIDAHGKLSAGKNRFLRSKEQEEEIFIILALSMSSTKDIEN